MNKTKTKKSWVDRLDKLTPVFQKISSFPYLRAIRDGFISCMPIILFSSMFLLIAFVPNIFGYNLPEQIVWMLVRAWRLSMGVLALFVASGTAKSLTQYKNEKLGVENQVPIFQVQLAAMIAFLMLAATPMNKTPWNGVFDIGDFGTRGLLVSFIVGFIVPNIFYFFFKNNITIKLPDEVPSNIARVFLVLLPFSVSTLIFWLWGWSFYRFLDTSFVSWFLALFRPLFSAADTPLGISLVFGAMAFFWFIGIHGPSVVEPIVSAAYLSNVDANFQAWAAGGKADKILAQGTQYFIATLGGTGATLMIIVLFAFVAKSKQLKSVGRASLVPGIFGVNEPVLFGAPLVLNPIYLIPFVLTPVVNVLIFYGFVKSGLMNGFIYNLPWTTPGFIGLPLGTNITSVVPWILVAVLLTVDAVIYYPFMKYHDKITLAEEAKKRELKSSASGKSKTTKPKPKTIKGQINVLVLCANGATSGMLANSIKKGSKTSKAKIKATATAWGQHKEIMEQFNVIILAPQMASMKSQLVKQIPKNSKIKVIAPTGQDYVKFVEKPDLAISWISEQL